MTDPTIGETPYRRVYTPQIPGFADFLEAYDDYRQRHPDTLAPVPTVEMLAELAALSDAPVQRVQWADPDGVTHEEKVAIGPAYCGEGA